MGFLIIALSEAVEETVMDAVALTGAKDAGGGWGASFKMAAALLFALMHEVIEQFSEFRDLAFQRSDLFFKQ